MTRDHSERRNRSGLSPPPGENGRTVEPIERRTESPEAGGDGDEEAGERESEGEREDVPEGGWERVDTGVDVSLLDACFTVAGPVAVGSDGKVLHRRPSSGEWRVIIEAGPSVTFNNIHDVDVTDDGERFWFVGDSGIIGAFDVREGRKYDFSAPMEKTSTWESIAVAGEKGDEAVIYANGSGELLDAEMDDDGYPVWGEVTKPGHGSTVQGVDFDADGTAYAADTTGKAYQQAVDSEERSASGNRKPQTSGDADWTEIGVRNAQVNFHDVDCDDGHLLIAGDDGIIYRFDRFADNWTPIRAGDGTIYAIDQFEGRRAASSADGRVFEPEMMAGWSERPTEAAEDLYGIALGPQYDIAVGADGTVVERHHGNQDRDRFEEPAETEETEPDDADESEADRPAERSRKRRERRREKRETVLAGEATEESDETDEEDEEAESRRGAVEETRDEFW